MSSGNRSAVLKGHCCNIGYRCVLIYGGQGAALAQQVWWTFIVQLSSSLCPQTDAITTQNGTHLTQKLDYMISEDFSLILWSQK